MAIRNAELPAAIVEHRTKMERVEVPCSYCSAEEVLVEAVKDRTGLGYFVFECETCDTAWRNTEPGIVERLVAAKLADS